MAGEQKQGQDLNQLLKVRREKLAELQAAGKDPFQITKYDVTVHSTDIKEIKNTLEFFGVDKEDEGNQKRLRDLENGQCLFQDLYGRVGVIQIHPVFSDLFHAFDTRPPVQTEESR